MFITKNPFMKKNYLDLSRPFCFEKISLVGVKAKFNEESNVGQIGKKKLTLAKILEILFYFCV